MFVFFLFFRQVLKGGGRGGEGRQGEKQEAEKHWRPELEEGGKLGVKNEVAMYGTHNKFKLEK